MNHSIDDLTKWNKKSDLKNRRSREIETVQVENYKLKNEVLTSTNLPQDFLKKLAAEDTVV